MSLTTCVRWFRRCPAWVRGGWYGFGICTLFFVFYLGLYFPLLQMLYPDGLLPNVATFLPTLTGHLFPLLSTFVFDPSLLCQATEAVCVHWNVDQGCIQQEMTIPSACRDMAEAVGFWLFTLGLEGLYVLVGALVAQIISKRRTV